MEEFENFYPQKAKILKRLIKQSIKRDYWLINGIKDKEKEIIYKRLRGFGKDIYYFTVETRLMDIAKKTIVDLEKMGKDMASGTIFFAEELKGAKGRLKRDWWSPKGGVYSCIVIYPLCEREMWGVYSLLVGVSVCEVLREWGLDTKIRWINDILLNSKKICGILTENFTSPLHNEDYIIIGIGLNVNIPEFPQHLPHATSILLETGRIFPEFLLSADIFSRIGFNMALFHNWLGEFTEEESINPIIQNFKLFSDSLGKRVVFGLDLENNSEIKEALIKDINNDGSITLMVNNTDININCGEIRYLD